MFQVKAIDPGSGLVAVPLPDFDSMTIAPVFSDVGTFTMSYPANGVNASYVVNDAELAVFLDGVEIPDTRVFLEEVGTDEANVAEDGVPIQVAGRTGLVMLESANVYPYNWPRTSNPGTYTFTNATPGAIMSTLIGLAQARGGLAKLTLGTWSPTLDSNGRFWATPGVSIAYNANTSVLAVLQGLVAQGLVEARMVGRRLDLYLPLTLGRDWTTANPPLVFRRGENVESAPRKTSTRQLANTILVAGANNTFIEVTDPTSVAVHGRREGAASSANISDPGTLAAFGQAQILLQRQKTEKTMGLRFTRDPGQRRPLTDYNLGDWVYSDMSNGVLERFRLQQWSVTEGTDGNTVGSVTLGDLIDAWEERVQRWIDGLNSGSTVTTPSPPPPGSVDSLKPAAPASVGLNSVGFIDQHGLSQAQITVTWPAVTTNSDGTLLTDLAGYEVAFLEAGQVIWRQIGGLTQELTAYYSPLPTGELVTARVRARDLTGNYSPWTTSNQITTAADSTPPPSPGAPVVTSRLGTITVGWNGLGVNGEAMPPDFAWVEVHASQTQNFTPSAATFVGRILSGRGSLVITGLAYNQTYWFGLISVDTAGNASVMSATSSGATQPLVDIDVIGQIINGANIQDGTVVASDKIIGRTITAGLIQGLTITAGEIAANAITADKIAAGAITAESIALGTLSTNLIINSGFEITGVTDPAAGSYTSVPNWVFVVLTGGAVTGSPGWVEYGSGTVDPRAGSAKAVLPCLNNANGTYVDSDPVAVVGGQEYGYSAWVAGTGRLRLRLLTGPSATGPWSEQADGIEDLLVSAVTPPYQPAKTSKVVPTAHTFAKVRAYNYQGWASGFFPGQNTAIYIDDVACTQLGFGAVELSANGLRMFNEFGDETMNLTGSGAGGDYLTIQNNGITQITLDANGDISGTGVVNAGSALMVAGTDFNDWMAQLAGGLGPPQGGGAWGVAATAQALPNATETGIFETAVDVVAGRNYLLSVADLLITNGAASTGYYGCLVRDGGTGSPTTASPIVAYGRYVSGAGAFSTVGMTRGFRSAATTDYTSRILGTGVHRLLFSVINQTGVAATVFSSGAGNWAEMNVIDIGPVQADVGVFNTGVGGTTQKKRYINYYPATWTHDYDGTGAPTAWTGNDDLIQGYYSSNHGNQRSLIGFNYLGFKSDLVGATISKVELFLWYYHWYYDTGGTAVLGYFAQTNLSAPPSFVGLTNLMQKGPWARNASQWVDIPNSVIAYTKWIGSGVNDARGITIGPGPTTNPIYYGSAFGKSSGHKPLLRITFVK